MKERVIKEIIDYLKIIIIAVILAVVVNKTLIVNAAIPSGSMEDTIHPGDRIIGLRPAYLFDDPKRGDIIIFKYPDDEEQTFIKRIIGLPGETVQVVDGKVYIDGSSAPLEEDYLKEKMEGDFGPYQVPEDSYFVMGDNRNHSLDSRYWENHFVTADEIIGKALFQYYPEIGKVE